MTRPSFAMTIGALRSDAAPDDVEVADLLAEIEHLHQGDDDEPDARGRWGYCSGCREPWPCAAWEYGEQLGLEFLVRGSARVARHARSVLDRLAGEQTPPVAAPGSGRWSYGVLGAGDGTISRYQGTWGQAIPREELLRLRYPPDGDRDRWVRDGPPGHREVAPFTAPVDWSDSDVVAYFWAGMPDV